ncbi:lethal(3)malignant brain tumor-like protein 3 [Drosophila suzukii]|uniref:Lethal(3)malignant brain tumor-like protein 3 n=1 Tax=Drosophila suzukii TaxID=28584 RepID=A0ABM4TXH8_DROSZ
MSTRVKRSEARSMMAAHQPSGGSSPGKGWSTTRPTRTSRRISGRGIPEPVIRSDNDGELVEDPRVEQQRWRLRRAVNRAYGRIPTGAAEVEWTSEEPPQDQQAPGSHAESLAAATWEYRRKCVERQRSEKRRLKEMEESPERQPQLRTAEEEEQQLWGKPGVPTHTEHTEQRQQPQREQPPPQQQPEQLEQPPPQQQPVRQQQPQRERRQQQQPDPSQQQPGNSMGQHIRTSIPAAHVIHSTRTFVAEGVRWRQQTVVWTWPEEPAEETAATEEPRIWEEWSPGEPAEPQDPRQTGALGPTDTEHRTDDGKDRAIDASANRERDGNRRAK